MKRHVIVATGLAVLSTSAFATKARMEALGQGTDSFYLEDTRSVFVNPAALNNNKNFVVTEWGFQDSTFANTTQQPEGGFFREMGSFAYGLYFGNESRGQNSMRNGTATGGFANFATVGDSNFLHHDNALDVFFAGDMGVQWGARLHYASNEDNSNTAIAKEQSALGLGFGVVMGDVEAYANLDLKDESTGATAAGDKWEADSGLNLGLKYNHMGMNLFADYDKVGAEYTAAGAAAVKTEQTTIKVGAARIHEVSSTARVLFDLRYVKTDAKDTKVDGTTQELNDSQLPLTIGFETEATSWLTLRGSVSQSVVINKKETKNTTTTKATTDNTTNVNAGATLNFGKMKVDGRVGYNSAAVSTKKDGGLRTDELLSTVGVSYWF